MSSISGRFLYQFGITAAVAVLVSLLVSFTLTPMMSARLLARRTDAGRRARRRPRSRARLLRAASTASTRGCSAGDAPSLARRGRGRARRHRLVGAALPAGASRSTSRATSTRPSSRSASRRPRARASPPWTRRCRRSRREVRATPGRAARCWRRPAAASSARVNQGSVLRAHRAARGAHVLARAGSGTGCSHGRPLRGLPRQLHPARRDAGGAPAAAQVPRPAHRRPQHRRRSTSAAATSTSTSSSAGPSSTTLARLRRDAAQAKRRELGGIVDADTTLQLDKPELRVADRPRAGGRPRRRHRRTSPPRCA